MTTTTPGSSQSLVPDPNSQLTIPKSSLQKAINETLVLQPHQPKIELPVFRGEDEDDEIGIFLKNYEMIGAAQGWGESELRRFLPASLRDTARNWLATDPSRLKKS